jgi:hypothetical protein
MMATSNPQDGNIMTATSASSQQGPVSGSNVGRGVQRMIQNYARGLGCCLCATAFVFIPLSVPMVYGLSATANIALLFSHEFFRSSVVFSWAAYAIVFLCRRYLRDPQTVLTLCTSMMVGLAVVGVILSFKILPQRFRIPMFLAGKKETVKNH